MDNEMRERLIEIINQAKCQYIARVTIADGRSIKGEAEGAADALIETGVILPKFKVGQYVWFKWKDGDGIVNDIVRSADISYRMIDLDNHYYFENELYATEAEAQQALKDIK